MSAHTLPSLPVGKIVATPNALAQLSDKDMEAALLRHVFGDWGDVCAEDKAQNDRALLEGTRILSVFRAANGTKFWLITEADRSVTTVLLPEDY
jgi:hypothetical protein